MLHLERIKPLVRQKGMTMTDLSKELGMSMQALCKIIRDNSTKVSTLEQLAHTLDVPVTYFFEDEDLKKKQELTEQERTELIILRERVQSLQIVCDAQREQIAFYKERERLLNQKGK